MKGAGYTRVSTIEQKNEGISLEVQAEKIKSYCAMAGIELVGTYSDNGVSGSLPIHKRKAGNEMLSNMEGVTNIVAYKLDRLFRDTIDCLQNVKEWDERGINLHLIDLGGQTLNTGSATGKFFLTTLAGLAELERGLCSERTKAVKEHQKVRGKWLGGIPPFGYFHQDGELHVAEPEVNKVRCLYKERAEGGSLLHLSNRHGVPLSTVSKILRNPIYAGLRKDKGGNLIPIPDFPSIIPLELWREINT